MNEVVTLLTSVSGRALVKSFSDPDVTEQPFSIGNLFNVFDESVSDLKSLSRLLYKLENEPTQTIIRGSLAEDKTGPVPRNKDIFIPTSRHWCMIDIDSLPWDGDLQDHKAMLEYTSSQLPPEFQQADCWYHFSSNMGIKQGIRVHLWYWLERPCSDDEMKAWLSGCPVDLGLFNPIQIHLTTNPKFVGGATDPYRLS